MNHHLMQGGDVTVLHVRSELDALSCSDLRPVLDTIVQEGARLVDVDLYTELPASARDALEDALVRRGFDVPAMAAERSRRGSNGNRADRPPVGLKCAWSRTPRKHEARHKRDRITGALRVRAVPVHARKELVGERLRFALLVVTRRVDLRATRAGVRERAIHFVDAAFARHAVRQLDEASVAGTPLVSITRGLDAEVRRGAREVGGRAVPKL